MPEREIIIRVKNFSDTTLGTCSIHTTGELVIAIDESLLERDDLRKLVVYHELMHCVFDVDHWDHDIDIMNEDSAHDEEILRNFPYYLKRAFERIRMEKFLESIKK